MARSAGALIPAEIWLNICDGFPQQSGDEFAVRCITLNHLSRTSKALRAVAQPLLWSKSTNRSAGTRGYLRFIRCSLAHPQLTKHPRKIELRTAKCTVLLILGLLLNSELIDIGSSSFESHYDSLVLSRDSTCIASGYSLSNYPQLPPSRYSALRLSNLERLSLEMHYDYNVPYSEEFRPSMNCLRNLGEIHVQWWFEKDGFQLDAIAGFLALTKLQIVTLHQAVDMNVSVDLPRNERLEHFRFLECYLMKDHLTRIVTAFSNIKTIEYYAADVVVTADTGTGDVTAGEFVDAIQPLTESLKHLTLVLSESYRREEEEMNVDNHDLDRATSFAAFGSLENLQIDATGLLGSLTCVRKDPSTLAPGVNISLKGLSPPPLISLIIIEVYDCFVGPFQELAMEVKKSLPNLRCLHIGFCKAKHHLSDSCAITERRKRKGYEDNAVVDQQVHAGATSTNEDRADHCDVLGRNLLTTAELPIAWQDVIAVFSQVGINVSIDWTSKEHFQNADGEDCFMDWVGESADTPIGRSRHQNAKS